MFVQLYITSALLPRTGCRYAVGGSFTPPSALPAAEPLCTPIRLPALLLLCSTISGTNLAPAAACMQHAAGAWRNLAVHTMAPASAPSQPCVLAITAGGFTSGQQWPRSTAAQHTGRLAAVAKLPPPPLLLLPPHVSMLPLLPPNLSRIFMAAHKRQGRQEQLVGSCGGPFTLMHALPESVGPYTWARWARAIGSSESGHCIAVRRPLDKGASQRKKAGGQGVFPLARTMIK